MQGLWGGEETPFLNPEKVEGQGGQNQLYERSPEKGLFREKFEEKTERETPARFFGNLGHVRRSQRASQNPAQEAPVPLSIYP